MNGDSISPVHVDSRIALLANGDVRRGNPTREPRVMEVSEESGEEEPRRFRGIDRQATVEDFNPYEDDQDTSNRRPDHNI